MPAIAIGSALITTAILAFHFACLWKAGRECHEQAVGKGWPRGDGGTKI